MEDALPPGKWDRREGLYLVMVSEAAAEGEPGVEHGWNAMNWSTSSTPANSSSAKEIKSSRPNEGWMILPDEDVQYCSRESETGCYTAPELYRNEVFDMSMHKHSASSFTREKWILKFHFVVIFFWSVINQVACLSTSAGLPHQHSVSDLHMGPTTATALPTWLLDRPAAPVAELQPLAERKGSPPMPDVIRRSGTPWGKGAVRCH
ncbi:hypothetical protein TRIUR3_35350 [Triticum urartu]|uniref:Uncharacterized protein n=1 Tax=Triticum urartu TaxID=4572 RepID=M8AI47_TRIUA|nr:hypothetical protein TRIUR3_35350 [Triticum urartu]